MELDLEKRGRWRGEKAKHGTLGTQSPRLGSQGLSWLLLIMSYRQACHLPLSLTESKHIK